MIKLSIVIPYYNTYEYTIKILNELRLQKTDEVEVILVDDGCNETRFDEFTEFKIIHAEHKGASAAYNEGIRQATGQYIGFIDSDDMIMMNYVEVLLQTIDQHPADEITFDWVDFNKSKIRNDPTWVTVWKGIYRREIIPWFDEIWECHTDYPFHQRLMNIKHTRYALHLPLYIYLSGREGSLTWMKKQGLIDTPGGQ